MAEKKITSDIRVEGKVITSGVQDPAGGSATEYWKTDGTKGTPAGGAAVSQTDLTDAATLSWDINAVPSAYLLATSAIGNTRMLSNASLANCIDGVNYQLTFQQDATGGRSMTFDTSFEAVGAFDLRPDKISIILINFQDGIGRVVVTSWEGITTGLSNAGAANFLLLNNTIKSLRAGTNITITPSETELLIEAAGGGGGGSSSVYNTVYVSVDGNDSTGELSNPELPFATIAAALNALPVWDNFSVWKIHILTEGTYILTEIPVRSLIFYSLVEATISYDSVGAIGITRSAPTIKTYLEFYMPLGHLVNTNTVFQSHVHIGIGSTLVLNFASVTIQTYYMFKVTSNLASDTAQKLDIKIGLLKGGRTLLVKGYFKEIDIVIHKTLFEGASTTDTSISNVTCTGGSKGTAHFHDVSFASNTARGSVIIGSMMNIRIDRFTTFGTETYTTAFMDLVDVTNSDVFVGFANLLMTNTNNFFSMQFYGVCNLTGNFYNAGMAGANRIVRLNTSGEPVTFLRCNNVKFHNVSWTGTVRTDGSVFCAISGTMILEDVQVLNSTVALLKTESGVIEMRGINIVEITSTQTLFATTSSAMAVVLRGKLWSNKAATGGSATLSKPSTFTDL